MRVCMHGHAVQGIKGKGKKKLSCPIGKEGYREGKIKGYLGCFFFLVFLNVLKLNN